MTALRSSLRFDATGRTALASPDEHLQGLIEEVLLTSPGERVHRPDFGSGLLAAVFAPVDAETAATTRLLVHAALQQWLGHLIEVEDVDVRADDSVLRVRVDYFVRRTQTRSSAEFTSTATPGGAP
jgi:uncharacterized protein